MAAIALQMVRYFQRTSFPTLISIGEKFIVLVGAPGTSINTAPTPKVAEQACKAIKARLPTESEYDFLSILAHRERIRFFIDLGRLERRRLAGPPVLGAGR